LTQPHRSSAENSNTDAGWTLRRFAFADA